jgi:hypothetical protein
VPLLVDPELAEPELADPELLEPELAEPELADPELLEPELAEPELLEPELEDPELNPPGLRPPSRSDWAGARPASLPRLGAEASSPVSFAPVMTKLPPSMSATLASSLDASLLLPEP